jgi:hypothetical protein
MHQVSPVLWCVRVADAVDRRVAQVDVGRGHVDLRAQHVGAVGKFAGAHLAEQVEVLLRAAVAVGLSLPGSVSVPRLARISSALCEST